VTHSGPTGDAGDVMWLCEEHASILAQQNEAIAKTLLTQLMKYTSFWDEKINEDGLLGLNVELLTFCNVPMGLASTIMQRIPQ